jgi:hypothetical protein
VEAKVKQLNGQLAEVKRALDEGRDMGEVLALGGQAPGVGAYVPTRTRQ